MGVWARGLGSRRARCGHGAWGFEKNDVMKSGEAVSQGDLSPPIWTIKQGRTDIRRPCVSGVWHASGVEPNMACIQARYSVGNELHAVRTAEKRGKIPLRKNEAASLHI